MQKERTNRVMEKLRRNEPVLVGTPTPFPSPKIPEMMGIVGYDCIWIDWEHQDLVDHDVFNMCLACRAAGTEPMVRVRKDTYWGYFRPLEMGATGLMVPHVIDASGARLAVRNSKFWPLGLRGMDGIEAPALYGMMPMTEYMKWANENTFICVQIEDHEALPNIEEIFSVDGVDGIFVGPGDLSQSLGIPCQFDAPEMQRAFELVAKAAKKTGKWWGAPAGSPERMRELLEMGARFLAWGAAVIILTQGYSSIKKQFDETLATWNSAAFAGKTAAQSRDKSDRADL